MSAAVAWGLLPLFCCPEGRDAGGGQDGQRGGGGGAKRRLVKSALTAERCGARDWRVSVLWLCRLGNLGGDAGGNGGRDQGGKERRCWAGAGAME